MKKIALPSMLFLLSSTTLASDMSLGRQSDHGLSVDNPLRSTSGSTGEHGIHHIQ